MGGMSVRKMWEGGLREEGVLSAEAIVSLLCDAVRLAVSGFRVQSAYPTRPLPAPSSNLTGIDSISMCFG